MAIRQGQFVDGQEKKARYVRYAPNSHSMCRFKLSRSAKTGCEQSQQNLRLFDHLVGAGEQRCGNFDAERLGRLQHRRPDAEIGGVAGS
jgi:hypothetical protein